MEKIKVKIEVKNLSLRYGDRLILDDINLTIPKNNITALIGPSGCGKSSFLRCFNRMNDLIDTSRVEGKILIDGQDIIHSNTNVTYLRRKIGMVFQKPNPFLKSIYENVAYGLKLSGIRDKIKIHRTVVSSLMQVGLWKEVKDRLHSPAIQLSGGQAQRLCIARTIAIQPDIILMDEPSSALDPASTKIIEKLILSLKKHYTVIIVTHNMQQAARVSDYTTFLFLGKIIESNYTKKLFKKPKEKLTSKYIKGKFG